MVGVDLLQSLKQGLFQGLSILELDELEGHLAPDADEDGAGQQTGVLHLLHAHYLMQKTAHEGEVLENGTD